MGQSQFFYRFIVLPGLSGLVCCACTTAASKETNLNREELTPLRESLDPEFSAGFSKGSKLSRDNAASSSQTPTTAQNQQAPPISASSASADYREGINLASSAYSLSQSAVSPDDWSLIASRWQRASEQLKKVSVGDERYEMAQQKATEYARNADHATAQLRALQRSVNTPPSARRSAVPIQTIVKPANGTANETANETARDSSGASKKVRVPVIRRLNGTPVIQVKFNGERSYEMILDTGASRTLITRQMADELGIVATEKMVAATASENEVTFDIGQMRSMSIKEITLRDARVSIGDAVTIGLLGNDFLYGYDVTIRADVVELAAAE